jgi:hypothetical protein
LDFKKFKANRGKLKKTVDKLKAEKPDYIDDRFWKPTVDKAGNSEAIIRFLPQKDLELAPIIMYFSHGFKHKGKWFFENCPSTISKDCPACEHAQPLWEKYNDSNKDTDKAAASKFSRGRTYVANILVIKDPAKPDNEGKVFLYRFGTKINSKILGKIAPESELEEAVLVYDMWEGQNFLVKVKKVGGYQNYDDSKFYDKICAVGKNDNVIEKVYDEIRTLTEFTDAKAFKSYEDLKKKFLRIMSGDAIPSAEDNVKDEDKEKVQEPKKSDDDFEFGADNDKATEKETPEKPADDEKKPEPEAKDDKDAREEKKADDDFSFEDGDDDFNFDDDFEFED